MNFEQMAQRASDMMKRLTTGEITEGQYALGISKMLNTPYQNS